MFDWLRVKVKNAVLAGISDALTEVDGGTADGDAVALLRARLTPALPAPTPDEEPAVNGKRRTKV